MRPYINKLFFVALVALLAYESVSLYANRFTIVETIVLICSKIL